MDVRHRVRLVAVLALVGGVWIARPLGQQTAEGGFTKAQADAGRATYKTTCASCHRADLGGLDAAPQLAGDDFMSAWKARKASELVEFIQATMPPEGPTLAPEQALGLVAFILQENGGTAGATALTASTAAPIGSVAPGKRPGPLVAAYGAVIR
jgi:mono/diheme cytochrome c family protein